MKELTLSLDGKILWIGGQNPRTVVEEQDARLGWIDVAEIMAHVKFGDIADSTSKFDAGGSPANNDEIEWRMPSVLLHLAFGEFEGEQDATADFDGVFDAFQTRSKGSPFTLAEVGVGRAGSED